ncbi:MAG: RNA-binding protein [Thalassobaculales bacterium]
MLPEALPPDARAAGTGAADDSAEADSGPLRRCLVTGAVLPKARLLRFVIGPGDQVVPDVDGRLPGRGLWVAADGAALARAAGKGLFARAARRPVTVPAGLPALVEALLVRRLLHQLGIARRAGQAVAGFEKVKAAIAEGACGLLLQARDGAADGRAKLAALAGTAPVLAVLDARELGEAFGHDVTVHAAVRRGRIAENLRDDAARLAGLRGQAQNTGEK